MIVLHGISKVWQQKVQHRQRTKQVMYDTATETGLIKTYSKDFHRLAIPASLFLANLSDHAHPTGTHKLHTFTTQEKR
jgi:hypothetical protein